jgi:hypothetical protein
VSPWVSTKVAEHSYSDPRDLYIYDALGQEVSLFATGVVPGDTSMSGWGLTKAMKSGDRLAVMMRCYQKMAPCGFRIYLASDDGKSASGPYSDFGALDIRSSTALLFTIAANDKLLVGFGSDSYGSLVSPIEMAWLSTDINQSSDVLTLYSNDILEASVAGVIGNNGDALDSGSVWEVEVNERGQTIVLVERSEVVDEGGLQSRRYLSHVLLYNDDFTVIDDYEPPSDVRILAIRSIEQGRLIIAGSLIQDEQTQVWFNMLTVDESGVFSTVWPEARIEGHGGAYAIDSEPSGEFVLAGLDSATGSLWLQRYDDSGAPLWPERVEVSPEEAETEYFSMHTPAVSIQSDGAIFLSSNGIAFVYCED